MSGNFRVCVGLSLLLWTGGPARATSQDTPWIAEEDLLDVGVLVLDPGIKHRKSLFDASGEPINPKLRQSEAIFMAVHLMRTLQETASFGPVRMLPSNSVSADLFVTGRIARSSGRRLALELEAVDATGRRWLKKRYKQKARPSAYAQAFDFDIEPFQEIYDRFVSALVRVQSRRKAEALDDLRRIAELRFAAQLAPGVFSDYLTRNGRGRIALDRLPARDDPMLARVRTIRTRDEFFLDLLTDRYETFYVSMEQGYDEFRASRYDVEIALWDATTQANMADSRARSTNHHESILEHLRAEDRVRAFRLEAAAQVRYLEEISNTFATEVDPLKLELNGEVIRFEGTIEEQYRQWQQVLERIFETDTGSVAREAAGRRGH